MKHPFAHEKLDCYALAVEVSHWFHHTSFPRGRAELRKQGQDAVDSIVLNIAEGAGRRKGTTDAGKNHHEIAPGLRRRMLRGARPRQMAQRRPRAAGEAAPDWRDARKAQPMIRGAAPHTYTVSMGLWLATMRRTSSRACCMPRAVIRARPLAMMFAPRTK